MSLHGFKVGDLDDQSSWISSGSADVASKTYVDTRFAEFEAALQDTLLILGNDQVPEDVRKKALAVLQRIRRGSGGEGPKVEITQTVGAASPPPALPKTPREHFLERFGGNGPKKIEIDVTFGHPGKAP